MSDPERGADPADSHKQRDETRWPHRLSFLLVVGTGGAAALGWEVVWQLHASLSLGVSSAGTALVLATTMLGMTLGSLLGARWLSRTRQPVRVYGVLELAIGLLGLTLGSAFSMVAVWDAAVFRAAPLAAPVFHLAALALVLGPPAMAMGASIPVLHDIAERSGVSLARLYAANTFGAVIGTLGLAFGAMPRLGVSRTSACLAAANAAIFVASLLLSRRTGAPGERHVVEDSAQPTRVTGAWAIVFASGFATFGLEVAWFRALRAIFQSTTDSFALMLAAVLAPLALAAALAPRLRRRGVRPESALVGGAVAILLTTPLLERVDQIPLAAGSYLGLSLQMLAVCMILFGPTVGLIGTALPWFLDASEDRASSARLYAVNTVGAASGALAAAWVLLPTLGVAQTSWALASLLVVVGMSASTRSRRPWIAVATGVPFLFAIGAGSSLGRDRILASSRTWPPVRILAFSEGPDSTVSVLQDGLGRALVIDGFIATREADTGSYMQWMGHLPALLHPSPRRGLVIAFGTGQTANALRSEILEGLDVVELDPAVLELASLFPSNRGVLDDPRVRSIAMDGRAWLRRNPSRYDVVTLEPMPPHFAGVNALYSREFYEILHERLEDGGVAAQWAPLHLLPPPYFISVVASFHAVFPNAALWLDPTSGTGILLGRKGAVAGEFGEDWPGLERPGPVRSMAPAAIRAALAMGPGAVAALAARGIPVTDDNQRLAYGGLRRFLGAGGNRASMRANRALIKRMTSPETLE